MPELPYTLERTVFIRATPGTVFRYFADSARWASWWGAGSTIDATPGGKVYIRHPNGAEVHGAVVESIPGERIVFTYGDASQVAITLAPDPAGTRLTLVHDFAESGPRDHHIQGWRFQLSLLGNIVANEVFSGAQAKVDGWFSAWAVTDSAERIDLLATIATPDVGFRDRFSLLEGAEDISAHIAATQRYMPGSAPVRRGEIRHCQGTVLSDWSAGKTTGVSVFEMHQDGRIASVTGVANTN